MALCVYASTISVSTISPLILQCHHKKHMLFQSFPSNHQSHFSWILIFQNCFLCLYDLGFTHLQCISRHQSMDNMQSISVYIIKCLFFPPSCFCIRSQWSAFAYTSSNLSSSIRINDIAFDVPICWFFNCDAYSTILCIILFQVFF